MIRKTELGYELFQEDSGAVPHYDFRVGADSQGRLRVEVFKDGAHIGTPIRFSVQDGRVTADLPGVNSDHFQTQDGHIKTS
jgi:hypothetical protein